MLEAAIDAANLNARFVVSGLDYVILLPAKWVILPTGMRHDFRLQQWLYCANQSAFICAFLASIHSIFSKEACYQIHIFQISDLALGQNKSYFPIITVHLCDPNVLSISASLACSVSPIST